MPLWIGFVIVYLAVVSIILLANRVRCLNRAVDEMVWENACLRLHLRGQVEENERIRRDAVIVIDAEPYAPYVVNQLPSNN